MTPVELRAALLVERYGDVIRAAHACLATATNWTPMQQRRHRAELDGAIRDHDARLPDRELAEAVVLDLPPRGEGVA